MYSKYHFICDMKRPNILQPDSYVLINHSPYPEEKPRAPICNTYLPFHAYTNANKLYNTPPVGAYPRTPAWPPRTTTPSGCCTKWGVARTFHPSHSSPYTSTTQATSLSLSVSLSLSINLSISSTLTPSYISSQKIALTLNPTRVTRILRLLLTLTRTLIPTLILALILALPLIRVGVTLLHSRPFAHLTKCRHRTENTQGLSPPLYV